MWVPTAKHKLIPALTALCLANVPLKTKAKAHHRLTARGKENIFQWAVAANQEKGETRFMFPALRLWVLERFLQDMSNCCPKFLVTAPTAKKAGCSQSLGLFYIEIHLRNDLCTNQPFESNAHYALPASYVPSSSACDTHRSLIFLFPSRNSHDRKITSKMGIQSVSQKLQVSGSAFFRNSTPPTKFFLCCSPRSTAPSLQPAKLLEKNQNLITKATAWR